MKDLVVLQASEIKKVWGGSGGFWDMVGTFVGEFPGAGLIGAALGSDDIGLDPHEQGESSGTKILYGDGSQLPNA